MIQENWPDVRHCLSVMEVDLNPELIKSPLAHMLATHHSYNLDVWRKAAKLSPLTCDTQKGIKQV